MESLEVIVQKFDSRGNKIGESMKISRDEFNSLNNGVIQMNNAHEKFRRNPPSPFSFALVEEKPKAKRATKTKIEEQKAKVEEQKTKIEEKKVDEKKGNQSKG